MAGFPEDVFGHERFEVVAGKVIGAVVVVVGTVCALAVVPSCFGSRIHLVADHGMVLVGVASTEMNRAAPTTFRLSNSEVERAGLLVCVKVSDASGEIHTGVARCVPLYFNSAVVNTITGDTAAAWAVTERNGEQAIEVRVPRKGECLVALEWWGPSGHYSLDGVEHAKKSLDVIHRLPAGEHKIRCDNWSATIDLPPNSSLHLGEWGVRDADARIILDQDLRHLDAVTVREGDDKRTLQPERAGANEWPWHKDSVVIEYARKDGRRATVNLTPGRWPPDLYIVVSAQE